MGVKDNIKDVCMICILSKRGMHGYELKKEIEERLGRSISPAHIYPLLKRMEEQGYVATKVEKRGGRIRKVYRLTAKGRKFCESMKREINFSYTLVEHLLVLCT